MSIIEIEHFSLVYSDGHESLHDITLTIHDHAINVLFGPATGGKSTLLRSINRLNELADVKSTSGHIFFHDVDVLDPSVNLTELRRRIGIVFSRPMPLPLTIYQNVSFGLEAAGEKNRARLDAAVERALRQAVLWDEVHDRLHDPANAISGGQQQRLCLARVLANEPEVILLDEPTSALDPVSTAKIEQLMVDLKSEITFVLVPHNVQQAARMADFAAFFLQGELVEQAEGKKLFVGPTEKRTQDYVEGRFG